MLQSSREPCAKRQGASHPAIVRLLEMATLTFLGAARTVTGSKYLLEVDRHKVLIDCGLFQGLKPLRLRNWAPFPFDPATLSAVVLTHAHIDHSGLLPRLVANGFHGPVLCTPGTQDLCSLVLPDAGHLQEEEAHFANRRQYSKHRPALPLFTEREALEALTRFRSVAFDKPAEIAPGLVAEFTNAGHLLGSAFVRISRADGSGHRILFGGDLGRYNRPVLPDPQPAPEAETMLVESTYGNREHPLVDDAAVIEQIVDDTTARGGRVIIPAFAIGRVEELLYWFKRLDDQGRLKPVPVYLDSPMAVSALNFYRKHEKELDADVRSRHADVCAFCLRRLQPIASPAESKSITASHGPAIVISASGMATGGRVLHHLAACLPDPRNTVLFVGFQSEGTRGRSLADGAKTVKIHGQPVPVAAHIARLDSMSAHADAREIIEWMRTVKKAPRTTYLVHGEVAAQDALKARIEATFRWNVRIPQHGEKVEVPL
jgi:metallo-beta-lactamase family protein